MAGICHLNGRDMSLKLKGYVTYMEEICHLNGRLVAICTTLQEQTKLDLREAG